MKAKTKTRRGQDTRLGSKSERQRERNPINPSFDAVQERLQAWNEQHEALLVEIGAGVVTQAGVGSLTKLSSGSFAVQLAGSRSMLLLDDKWARYAKLNKDGKRSTLLASQKGTNAPWIRLSDDLGDHGGERLVKPTEADIQMALGHFTVLAQTHTRIIFGSATKISEVNFVARLVGPRDDDSFLVVGDPESGLRRIGGQILLRSAEYVHIQQNKDHVAVILRTRDGNTCSVFHGTGPLEDQMLILKSMWKVDN